MRLAVFEVSAPHKKRERPFYISSYTMIPSCFSLKQNCKRASLQLLHTSIAANQQDSAACGGLDMSLSESLAQGHGPYYSPNPALVNLSSASMSPRWTTASAEAASAWNTGVMFSTIHSARRSSPLESRPAGHRDPRSGPVVPGNMRAPPYNHASAAADLNVRHPVSVFIVLTATRRRNQSDCTGN